MGTLRLRIKLLVGMSWNERVLRLIWHRPGGNVYCTSMAISMSNLSVKQCIGYWVLGIGIIILQSVTACFSVQTDPTPSICSPI